MRVLLVEDSTRLQAAVARGLRRSGYAVDVTGNGEEGLWLATSNDGDKDSTPHNSNNVILHVSLG